MQAYERAYCGGFAQRNSHEDFHRLEILILESYSIYAWMQHILHKFHDNQPSCECNFDKPYYASI